MNREVYFQKYKLVYRIQGAIKQDVYVGYGNAMAARNNLIKQGITPALKFA